MALWELRTPVDRTNDEDEGCRQGCLLERTHNAHSSHKDGNEGKHRWVRGDLKIQRARKLNHFH